MSKVVNNVSHMRQALIRQSSNWILSGYVRQLGVPVGVKALESAALKLLPSGVESRKCAYRHVMAMKEEACKGRSHYLVMHPMTLILAGGDLLLAAK